MAAISHLFTSLALLALVFAGLSAIVQAKVLAESLLRFAVVFLGLSFAIPMLAEFARAALEVGAPRASLRMPDFPASVFAPVLIGHVVVVAAVVRRRLRGRDHARDERAETTRARSRFTERVHLPPSDEREP